ncbi:MAG: hypothetical protein JNL39_05490 [Opitutaceae bacterium]|nr:hypothetical protein [Opitutaceae bacterium]
MLRRTPTPLLAALLLAIPAPAAPAAAPGAVDNVRERILRMTDFLDTVLPGVLAPDNMTLQLRPKLGDLRDYEYLRFPAVVRYGLTEQWELLGGLMPFTPNPINRGREHRWGPGEAKLGARYDVGRTFGFFDDTTVGFEARIPLGHPPVTINDHYTHLKPFVTAARTLRGWPATTLYFNFSYDRSVDLTHRTPVPQGPERRNIIEGAPGLLYKPGEFGWFVESRVRHIRNDAGHHLAHEFQLGSIWDVPLARTGRWGLPGKWQAELAYRVGHEEGRGHDTGFSARVNWRTTLREVLNHRRAVRTR